MVQLIKEDISRLHNTSLPAVIKHNLTPYTGIYETEDKKVISITDQEGLVCQFNNFPKEKLHNEGDDYFAGFYYEVWFITNGAVEIVTLRLVDVSG